MAKVSKSSSPTPNGRPALTPESRELQLISLAVDLAEQQLRDGTASSQVISHFLKLGSSRAELEREKLARENELLRAKADSIQAQQSRDDMFREAIEAMRRYQGVSGGDQDEY